MIGSLLLIATALVGQTPTAEADTLKVEVRKLVHQLDSPRLEKREAAEKRLVELGPEVLPLLPEPNEDMSAEVKKRVDSIRHQVQETAAKTSAQASVVTLHSPGMKLSKILADFQKQTGNPIIDDRAQRGQPVTDPELKADFDKTPFWKALDTVLDQAGLAVDAFSPQHGICVVARPSGQAPRSHGSYSGPFRFEAVRVFASRDLRNPAGGALMLGLEVAWEPRLRPVGLKQPMADIVAQDENGKPLAVDDRKADVESLVQTDASAIKLDLSHGVAVAAGQGDRPLPRQPPGHGARQDGDLPLRRSAHCQERGEAHRRRHRDSGPGAEERTDFGKCACGCGSTRPATRWRRSATGSCKTRPCWKTPTARPFPRSART